MAYIHQIEIPNGDGTTTVYDIRDQEAWEQLSQHLEKKVVSVLPDPNNMTTEQIEEALRSIYLVPSSQAGTQNVNDEYILIDNGVNENPRYRWEKIGSTETDLSGYSLKGHTHQVTPQTRVADHKFNVTGTIPVPTFVGEASSFSGSGSIGSGDVTINVNPASGTGTSYTPEVSVGGVTEDAGAHTHTVKKTRKYLKKGTVRGVNNANNKKASKVESTTVYQKVAQVADQQTSIPKYNVTQGTVTLTPTTEQRATGELEDVATGNDANAVFHSATVTNGVLSFGLKQMATGNAVTGATASTNASVVTPNGTEDFYAAKDGNGVTINHHELGADVDVPEMDSETSTVATGELTTDSAQGVAQVVEDIGGSTGDDVTTSEAGTHDHALETKAGGVTTSGIEKKFSGSIANGSVSISGSMTPQGHNTYEGTSSGGRFTSDEITLSHSVFNPTVITSPDDASGNHTTDWYGIAYNETTDRACDNNTRIGNMTFHKTLPIQSNMRRCLLKDDGTVNYYLLPTDSTKKMDGTDAVLDGTDGQVMVEVPEHWRYVTIDENDDVVAMISPYEQTGWIHVKKFYVSAYEAALDRTNQKLASVVNMTARYRGGNNTAAWDETYRSLLGMPATSISITNYRTYARNRGASGEAKWNCYTWDIHVALYWLYVIEYANRNCQAAFNETLTADGYRQGGLGAGVTEINDTNWSAHNSYNPMVPCGTTNSLGNNTGVVTYNVEGSDGATLYTAQVPSWRGIENPFGHIWKGCDGIKYRGNGTNQDILRCSDPLLYSNASSSDGYTNIGTNVGSDGYKSKIIFGDDGFGDINCKSITGGGSTYFYADNNYQSHEDGTYYACYVGGLARSGANAGLACVRSNSGVASSYAYLGSRLCFF